MIDLLKRIFRRKGVDKTIYVCVVILTVFGIVMIGSASVGQTASEGTSFATVNMIKQTVFVVSGFGFMIFLTRCFKRMWINYKFVNIIFVVGIIALIICRFFSHANGSYAWIRLPGGFSLQPAEFMKVIMILFLAFYFGEMEEMCQIPKQLSRKEKEDLQIRKFRYCLGIPIAAIAITCFIILFIQKDFGSAFILGFICLMMFFVTPRPYYTKYKKLAGIALLVVVIVAGLTSTIFLKGYQLGRIETWLHPTSDYTGSGFQLTNGLIAFSNGGLLGRGFGASKEKYGYIPESHNDFIAPVIYEELGMVGFMLFMIPYIIIIYKMFDYGMKMKETKCKLVLYGVGIYFFTHLFINIGGVSGLIPMTGVPLLLISSGGSSTWAAMIALGIAQSMIARYNRDSLKEQI